MSKRNYSSWAEEVDLEELNAEASKYDFSLGVLDDIQDALTKSTSRIAKKSKIQKCRRECWH